MDGILIRSAKIVNEGVIVEKDVLIQDGIITKVDNNISLPIATNIIYADGKYLLPGVIDTHVHFREPGLTEKGDIAHESRAAVAGGVTSFIDMPNTLPPAITAAKVNDKFKYAAKHSLANYSFMIGATEDNTGALKNMDVNRIPAIKLFMGNSTGDIGFLNHDKLDKLFAAAPTLICAHCEDNETIEENLQRAKARYGDDIPVSQHPFIRSQEACVKSSKAAVRLAEKYRKRLHVLHISTDVETDLFSRHNIKDKKITAEACIHHLMFTEEDYETRGNLIKVNPAVKRKRDREALWEALDSGKIDTIGSDHAPHLLEEKLCRYIDAPSGAPMIQYMLPLLLDEVTKGKLSLAKLVDKLSHNPAAIFKIEKRGFIREGYYADLVLVDLARPHRVSKDTMESKCRWSSLEGKMINARVSHTIVNGFLVYNEGKIDDRMRGMELSFENTPKNESIDENTGSGAAEEKTEENE